MTDYSKVFYEQSGEKYFYNIMPLANIGSVMQTGILSHNECKKLVHASVALESVQTRKALVSVPNGLRLHDYANVYFDCRNPMMSKIRGRADDICVLVINSDILNIKDVVVTDRNAASSVAFFGNPSEMFDNNRLDYTKIYAEYWTDDDQREYIEKKAIKCAEVLVPHNISFSRVLGAYVVSRDTESKLRESGFDRKIAINRNKFFS